MVTTLDHLDDYNRQVLGCLEPDDKTVDAVLVDANSIDVAASNFDEKATIYRIPRGD